MKLNLEQLALVSGGDGMVSLTVSDSKGQPVRMMAVKGFPGFYMGVFVDKILIWVGGVIMHFDTPKDAIQYIVNTKYVHHIQENGVDSIVSPDDFDIFL